MNHASTAGADAIFCPECLKMTLDSCNIQERLRNISSERYLPMSLKFNVIHKESLHEDNTAICNILRQMAQDGSKVKLINYYKELPIKSITSISEINDMRFEAFPSSVHTAVLQEKQKTFIQLQNECYILADCPVIYPDRGTVILYNFAYVTLHTERRYDYRVRFDHPINVILYSDKRKMPGMLCDISCGGACMITFMRGLSPGMHVGLPLKFFDADTKSIINFQLQAKIIRLEKEVPPFLCCIQFEPDKGSEAKLIAFVNQRQIEIIKALKLKSYCGDTTY